MWQMFPSSWDNLWGSVGCSPKGDRRTNICWKQGKVHPRPSLVRKRGKFLESYLKRAHWFAGEERNKDCAEGLPSGKQEVLGTGKERTSGYIKGVAALTSLYWEVGMWYFACFWSWIWVCEIEEHERIWGRDGSLCLYSLPLFPSLLSE